VFNPVCLQFTAGRVTASHCLDALYVTYSWFAD